MRQVIFLKGVKIGEIDLENSYYLSYRNDLHVFHIFDDGFGISEKVLDFLYQKKIDKIMINYKDKILLSQDIDIFLIKAKDWTDGNDKQLVLEGKFWNKELIEYKQERLTI